MKLDRPGATQRAVTLAARSPLADPNPRVGCVIVRADGTLLAEGHHRGAGTPHAEAAALADARASRADLTDATAYVTLEPCAHVGRTPSCAHALVEAGVARVVYGQADPNAEASGGAEILRRAGIRVEQDADLARESKALNEEWTFSVTHGRPFVRWKFAATLDGFSAAEDGASQWITGRAAREDVHVWRARHGAVLVGTGTALADDPRLTVRDDAGNLTSQQPLRVVMGRRELPDHLAMFDDAAETLVLPTRDPVAALSALRERGIHAVWLEGGPTLAAAFVTAGLVDEVVAYVAPAMLGSGRAAVGDLGATSIADLRRFDLVEATLIRTEPAPDHPAQTDMRLVLRPLPQHTDVTTQPARPKES